MSAAPTTLDELEDMIVQRRNRMKQGHQFQNEDTDYEIHQALARISVRWGRKIEVFKPLAEGLKLVEAGKGVAFAREISHGVFKFIDEFDELKAAIFYAMRDRLSRTQVKS